MGILLCGFERIGIGDKERGLCLLVIPAVK